MLIPIYQYTIACHRIDSVAGIIRPNARPLRYSSFDPMPDSTVTDLENRLHTETRGGESVAFVVAAPGARFVERPPLPITLPNGDAAELPRGRAVRNHWGDWTADHVASLASIRMKGFRVVGADEPSLMRSDALPGGAGGAA